MRQDERVKHYLYGFRRKILFQPINDCNLLFDFGRYLFNMWFPSQVFIYNNAQQVKFLVLFNFFIFIVRLLTFLFRRPINIMITFTQQSVFCHRLCITKLNLNSFCKNHSDLFLYLILLILHNLCTHFQKR